MIRRIWLLLATVAALLAAWPAGAALAQGSPQVSVYPSPGTTYNLPGTQITFRGIPPSQIGNVTVTGSASGAHRGRIAGDSDGGGGSFLPNTPFRGGETVTVTTSLSIVGGQNGTFTFKIENPSRPIGPGPLPLVQGGANTVQHFHSRPDLQPPALAVTKASAPASEGDIFVAPQFGPVQNGPMILDPSGHLLWFDPYPVTEKELVTDFRVQNLYGKPVLTWFQGTTNHGTGEGEGIILDQNYNQIATVKAGNGLQMDLHELLVTPQGDAYILAFSPVSLPNVVHKPLLDCVVQEIDIKTGLVLFEWHALDHIPLSYSNFSTKTGGYVYDPYHANSVGLDSDGNLIVSLRNTSAVYKLNRSTGKIMWEFGGKHSSFKMGSGTITAFQHDAVVQPDGTITIFDDGAGPPKVHQYARGIQVALDTGRMTARLVHSYAHSPQISTNFEGSVQELSGGDVFIGWGQQPYFSEVNAAGAQIFDAHFVEPSSSYRAYRFPWNAQPPTQPTVAQGWAAGDAPVLYASWDGATDVAAWRLLAGTSRNALTPIARASRSGFETSIGADTEAPYLQAQPLDAQGHVLASSGVVSVPRHVEIYGASAFVPPSSGFGGLPVGCFTGKACRLTTKITSGRTVLAATGTERMGAGATGLVYFQLSGAGRAMLSRARSHRLPVTVRVTDSSGVWSSRSINLVAFSTRGSGPRRSASGSPALSLVGSTDFVNSHGVGGILAACHSPVVPCAVNLTVSAGSTVIGRTGREFIGAGDLGYVIFSLTSTGRSMLSHASGNQLGVQVKLTSGSQSASGQLALVGFS
ncbi:MAG TPA: arylsulfotransferase family protein [Solirubrobacteraceae bacterium]|nr:arylsulfotransferase family protein [Solirubrobacteraceae bacterium]